MKSRDSNAVFAVTHTTFKKDPMVQKKRKILLFVFSWSVILLKRLCCNEGFCQVKGVFCSRISEHTNFKKDNFHFKIYAVYKKKNGD